MRHYFNLLQVEYIFICVQISKKLFNRFTCNKPIITNFNAVRQSSTALSHISLVLYQSETESNTKEQVLTAIIHIY